VRAEQRLSCITDNIERGTSVRLLVERMSGIHAGK
jgi:hypothetical protein